MEKSKDSKVNEKGKDNVDYGICLNCGYIDKGNFDKCPDCDSQAIVIVSGMKGVLMLKEQIRGILWS